MANLPETNANLIARLACAHDASAWNQFIDVYAPAVYRLARRHGLQHADAEDMVQNVSAAVVKSIQTWSNNPDRGGFRAWLFRIARNAAVNYVTRCRRRLTGAGDSNVRSILESVPDSDPDIDADFEFEYRRQVFAWAAERVRNLFHDKTWQAFWLTSVDNLDAASVAQQLETSVGSVYIARSRVMHQLRKAVRLEGAGWRALFSPPPAHSHACRTRRNLVFAVVIA